ncbi:DUF4282 domain-containing protein [Dermacoccaceae bacterium W4C1]
MSNGSWNDNGPTSGPNPHYGAGQQGGQPSLGQGYSQQSQGGNPGQDGPYAASSQGSYPAQNNGGDQAQYGNPGQSEYTEGPSHGYGAGSQPQYAQAEHSGTGAPNPAGTGSTDSAADLFTDFGFKKSLTEKIASVTFLVVVIWAVLRLIRVLANAWGSQEFGDTDVRNMGGFEAFMASLEALGVLVVTVAVARVLLELCVNVARLATRRR